MSSRRVIAIHPDAPTKPAPGAACNGCGVCCAAEPCPAGMLLTRRLRGPCGLLRWDDAGRLYRCSLMTATARSTAWSAWLQRIARRWIAAGQGCDASLEVETAAQH